MSVTSLPSGYWTSYFFMMTGQYCSAYCVQFLPFANRFTPPGWFSHGWPVFWPVQCSYGLLILQVMSVTLVLCRITLSQILSFIETPSIFRAIPRFVTLSAKCCNACVSEGQSNAALELFQSFVTSSTCKIFRLEIKLMCIFRVNRYRRWLKFWRKKEHITW